MLTFPRAVHPDNRYPKLLLTAEEVWPAGKAWPTGEAWSHTWLCSRAMRTTDSFLKRRGLPTLSMRGEH